MGRPLNDLPAEIVIMILGNVVSRDDTKRIYACSEEIMRNSLVARRVCRLWYGVLTELILKKVDLELILTLAPDPLCLEALKILYGEWMSGHSKPAVKATNVVEQNPPFTVFDPYLNVVIENEKLSCIDFILHTYPNLGEVLRSGVELLEVAISARSHASVLKLLQYEWIRRWNGCATGSYSPLEYALISKQYAIAEVLLKHGSSRKIRIVMKRRPNSTVDVVTAISYAVVTDDKKMLEFLLDNGFDPNDVAISGDSAPLVRALLGQNVEMAKLLIDGGSNVSGLRSPFVWSPLEAAIMECPLDIVKILVGKGASVNEIGWFGYDPLQIAILHRKADIVSFLLDSGAAVGLVHILRCVVEFALLFPNQPLENGRDVCRAYSAFYISCMLGADSSVQLLMQYGIDVNAGYCEPFRSPLEAAVHHKRASTAELLLSDGADPSMVDPDKLKALLQGKPLVKEVKSLTAGNWKF